MPQRYRLGKGIGQTRGKSEFLEVVAICDHLCFLHCRQGASRSAPTFFGTNIVARVSPPALSMTRFLDAMGSGELDFGAGGDTREHRNAVGDTREHSSAGEDTLATERPGRPASKPSSAIHDLQMVLTYYKFVIS